jgi:3-oxoacyl-[acyl-carrier-protein] synthase-3
MQRRLIRGVGRYLPRRVVHNHELAAACGLTAEQALERSGVRERRRADPQDEGAAEMGAHAAREALAQADMAPSSLDLILNASGTPLQALPDAAPFIQAALGLGRSGIASMSVGSACLSFLSALDMAASLLATQRYRRILIVSSEVSSAGLDFRDPETAPLFGDAAAAVVVTLPDPHDQAMLHGVHFETYGDGASLTEIPGCGTRRPPSSPLTRMEDGLFRMNGPALLKFAARRARPFLQRLEESVAPGGSEGALLIPHQPSRAGLRLLELLGFAPERMVVTLGELGNCVAASIPLALYEAITSKRLMPGDRALLLGTGAGVSFGGAVLTY